MSLQPAYAAWRAGRLEEAARHCQRFLSASPDNVEGRQLLGAIFGSTQNHRQAAENFQLALSQQPGDTSLRKNLVRAHLQLGEFDVAEQVLKDGLAVQESDELWSMLAVVYAQAGRLDDGIQAIQNALRLNPRQSAHLFGLAELQRMSGDREGAIGTLRNALEADPKNPAVLNNLAGLELYSGNFLEALRAIEKLLAINPRSAQAQCNLAMLLSIVGDMEQAVTALRNALAIEPGLYRARIHLATFLLQTGAVDEAETMARNLLAEESAEKRQAIAVLAKVLERRKKVEEARELLEGLSEEDLLTPDLAISLAVVQDQQGQTREAVETLLRSVEKHEMAATDGIGCHFVLGSFYDKLEEYDLAFEHYEIGNRNRKRAIVEVLEKDEEEDSSDAAYRSVLEFHTRERYGSFVPAGSPSEVPVFIVGMPRSGTTLSEQILASHPAVFGAGELNLMLKVIADSYGKTPVAPGQLAIGQVDQYSSERGLMPKDWYQLSDEQVLQLAHQYLDPVIAKSPESGRITDKMPYNYFVLPIIHRLFPNARIIHCRRHPLDTCLSCFFQNFTSGNQFSFDLEELAAYYRQYVQVMDYYRELGIPMYETRYEELVSAPEDKIRSLLDYCGLEWDPRCLEFHRNKRTVNTASYQQVRVPLYNTSVGRWQHYRQHLQPLIDSLADILEDESVEAS